MIIDPIHKGYVNYKLMDEQEISNDSIIEFTDLNGDDEGPYLLQGNILANTATTNELHMRINGDTGAGSYALRDIFLDTLGNNLGYDWFSSNSLRLGYAAPGQPAEFHFELEINTAQSWTRRITGWCEANNHWAFGRMMYHNSYYANATASIASISLFTLQSNLMTDGVVRLYRLLRK